MITHLHRIPPPCHCKTYHRVHLRTGSSIWQSTLFYYTLSHRKCGYLPSSPLSCNFCRLRNDFVNESVGFDRAECPINCPSSSKSSWSFQSCMTKVTRVSKLSMGQSISSLCIVLWKINFENFMTSIKAADLACWRRSPPIRWISCHSPLIMTFPRYFNHVPPEDGCIKWYW